MLESPIRINWRNWIQRNYFQIETNYMQQKLCSLCYFSSKEREMKQTIVPITQTNRHLLVKSHFPIHQVQDNVKLSTVIHLGSSPTPPDALSLKNSLTSRFRNSQTWGQLRVISGKYIPLTRKHSSRMLADRSVTWISSHQVAMRPIVDRHMLMKTLPSLAIGNKFIEKHCMKQVLPWFWNYSEPCLTNVYWQLWF